MDNDGKATPRTAGAVQHEPGALSAARRRQRIRGPRAAVSVCAVAGLAVHAFGRPMAAAVGLMAAAVVIAAVAVTLAAMLGGRDRRSPFERLALIICVITGRRPGDYLPPASDTRITFALDASAPVRDMQGANTAILSPLTPKTVPLWAEGRRQNNAAGELAAGTTATIEDDRADHGHPVVFTPQHRRQADRQPSRESSDDKRQSPRDLGVLATAVKPAVPMPGLSLPAPLPKISPRRVSGLPWLHP